MKTIIGVFDNRAAAEQAIGGLREHGIADADISYVGGAGADGEIDTTTVHTGDGESVAEGAGAGAVTGGVIGAIAGLVVANGILPGLGTLFVAGPIATALGLTGAAATTAAGALTGAAAGGLIGAITNLGASEEDAKVYEERVRSGGVLVAAEIGDHGENEVREVYTRNGADQINVYIKD
jgi:hypothetical protein